jgi:glutaredoxin
MSLQITFYTKPNCPLCEEAEELLDEMRGYFDFSVLKIDITRDIDAYEIFKHRIPVLRLGDLGDLSEKITEKELRQKIRAFLKTSPQDNADEQDQGKSNR